MPNFKIVFKLEVKTNNREYREGPTFERIITAQNRRIAKKVAKAMIGEEVYVQQYLSKVQSVTPTDEEPFISPFCTSRCVWDRVLQRLGFWGDGQVVLFTYHQADLATIQSGILFTPKQIRRVLRSILKP